MIVYNSKSDLYRLIMMKVKLNFEDFNEFKFKKISPGMKAKLKKIKTSANYIFQKIIRNYAKH